MTNNEMSKFRAVDILDENKASIKFLYNTIPGRILLKLVTRTTVSKLAGCILRCPASRFLIKRFIKQNSINMDEYRSTKFKSFDDFFIREIKEGCRPFSDNENDLASPCDSKLTVYDITPDSIFTIKHSQYSIKDLLKDKYLSKEYSDGICMVFRLSPDDYHRYCFIDDGKILQQKKIKGALHTVRPIAYQNRDVFCQNAREYTVIETKNFGKIIQMEVGALFVGKISNHKKSTSILRAEEKGMFQFGGSTIILIFKKDTITVDSEIVENTMQNKETIIRMGEKIGEKQRNSYQKLVSSSGTK